MLTHRRPLLVLSLAFVLVAAGSAWLAAATGDPDTDAADSTSEDGDVLVYEDLDDAEASVVSGELAREIHRAVAEAMAGLDEALQSLHEVSVHVDPLEGDRGRVRIRVDRDGHVDDAVIDPSEIERHVHEALAHVDFDRVGDDLERSMDQLGEELGRMGEEFGQAFEADRGRADAQRHLSREQDGLDREIRELKREIRRLQREIERLQAAGDSAHYD